MLKHICYINDNYIDLKTNTTYHITSESIKNGNIVNREKFIADYKKLIKKPSVFSKSIKILLNKEILESDILYYSSIFEELNYSKIDLISTSNYLENDTLISNGDSYILYHNNLYININKSYLNNFINSFNLQKIKVLSHQLLPQNQLCVFYYYNNIDKYFFI